MLIIRYFLQVDPVSQDRLVSAESPARPDLQAPGARLDQPGLEARPAREVTQGPREPPDRPARRDRPGPRVHPDLVVTLDSQAETVGDLVFALNFVNSTLTWTFGN